MTYKEIVDRFEAVANDHYMIKDFGYGQLSDIKTQSQDSEADYPYMFLNPASHTRNGVIMKYNFNVIMMDIAGDEDSEYSNFLAIQSKCTQYIDDVIAELYYGFTDKPEINMSNITYTPFKERFQDALAGVTAVITIDVPTPINRCVAPFPNPEPPAPVDCVLSEWSEWSECIDNQQFRTRTVVVPPSDGGLPCGDLIEYQSCEVEPCNLICVVERNNSVQYFDPETGQSPLAADTIVLDTYNGWRPLDMGGNFYVPGTFDPLTWTITGSVMLDPTSSQPGDVIPLPFSLEDVNSGTVYQPTQVIGWLPENATVGVVYSFVLIYDNIPVTSTTNGWQAVILKDTPEPQAGILVLAGVNIQICQPGVVPNPVPEYEALVYTNTTTRTLSNSNAAFVFETEYSDPTYFLEGAYSNYYGQKVVPFDAVISFEGTMTYKVGFDPSLYQLAIYNKEQDLFFGMVDLPATDGVVSISSEVFEYLPAQTDPFGEPIQEVNFLTLYQKGTANPNPFPPATITNPFTYNGTFKIKVNN